MDIPFAKHTLPNGLDVVVHEDRGLPIIAVNVWRLLPLATIIIIAAMST